jgi:hypothetical protein
MKKLLGILILNLLLSSESVAKVGTGNINLSDQVIRDFIAYVQSAKRKPVRFLITGDGQEARSWFCPYSRCDATGSADEERLCRNETGKDCFTFALRRNIKWKNEFTRNSSASEKKFTSKDDFSTIKEKLTKLGFIDNDFSLNTTKPKKQKEKEKEISKDLIKHLKSLSELYESGALTKEEFQKAKKKILN